MPPPLFYTECRQLKPCRDIVAKQLRIPNGQKDLWPTQTRTLLAIPARKKFSTRFLRSLRELYTFFALFITEIIVFKNLLLFELT